MTRALPIFVLGFASSGAAQERSAFEPPVRIDATLMAQGNIDGAVLFADLDGDGDRDLLVGRQSQLLRLINGGTDAEPAYGAPDPVMAGGRPLEITVSCGLGMSPQLVDLNGDGHLDLLSGSFPSDVLVFAGDRDGNFAAGAPVRLAGGDPLTLDAIAGAFAADWNADGHLDLFVASRDGRVFVHEGAAGGFGAGRTVDAGGRPVVRRGLGMPWFVDWDGDELLDLVAHDAGGDVVWYRNEGRKGEPVLGEAHPLLASPPRTEPKICCLDWNRDGALDLVLAYVEMVDITAQLTDAEHAELARAKRRLSELSAELAALNKQKPDLTEAGLRARRAAREALSAKIAEPRAIVDPLEEKTRRKVECPFRADLYLRR